MTPPRLLRDLYGDLRDRRLLPVVGLLVAAIAAVPLLLESDAEPPPADLTAAAAVEEEIPSMPAVLAAQPGLRDYRERLDGRGSKSPFAREAAAGGLSTAEIAAVESVGEAAGPAAGSTTAAAAGGDAASGVAGASESGSTESSAATAETVVSGSGGKSEGGKSGGGSSAKPDPVHVAFRVDVEVGHLGDADRRENVKLLTVLPSQSNPVAMFLGASEDGKSAVFLVSEDVTGTHGDGTCLPSAARCEFLTLKPGQQRRFDYGSDQFVLKLLDVSLAPVKKSLAAGSQTDGSAGGGDAAAREQLSAWLGLPN